MILKRSVAEFEVPVLNTIIKTACSIYPDMSFFAVRI